MRKVEWMKVMEWDEEQKRRRGEETKCNRKKKNCIIKQDFVESHTVTMPSGIL